MPSNAVSQPIILAIMSLLTAGHHKSPTEGPALTISGEAAPTVTSAKFYTFTPDVRQHGFRALRFNILNKPSWASFGQRHGTLYGVPTAANAGTYSNIIITVSDGETTVQLPAFSIRVDTPPAASPVDAG